MLHSTAIKQLYRPARLAALDRARTARERVVHLRNYLRTAYCVFSPSMSVVEEELAESKQEWREALAEMQDAKLGLIDNPGQTTAQLSRAAEGIALDMLDAMPHGERQRLADFLAAYALCCGTDSRAIAGVATTVAAR